MEIRNEWYEGYRKLYTLYRVAKNLGQTERAKELEDKIYRYILDHHQRTLSVIRRFKEMEEESQRPETKTILRNLVDGLSLKADEFAGMLNQFSLDEITNKLDE